MANSTGRWDQVEILRRAVQNCHTQLLVVFVVKTVFVSSNRLRYKLLCQKINFKWQWPREANRLTSSLSSGESL